MEAVEQLALWRGRLVTAMALVGALSALAHVLAWTGLFPFATSINTLGVALMTAGPVVSLAGFFASEGDERRQWPAVVSVIAFFVTGTSWAILFSLSLFNPAK